MQESAAKGLLDPVDRISEILFGLIMAVTIVGSLSIASAGRSEVREVLHGALGCNLAWGLVDAVMYLLRTATERARNLTVAHAALAGDAMQARHLMRQALPAALAALVGDEELDGMRRRLAGLQLDRRRLIGGRDVAEALAVFTLVVAATFPVVVPFLLFDELGRAMNVARIVTLVSLFVAGMAFGRYAGYRRPLLTGLAMATFGAVLIVTVMALGG